MTATTTAAIAFSSIGAAFEVAGVILVAREIARDRARGRRLLDRLDASTPTVRSYPPPLHPSFAAPDYASPAWAPSMHIRGVIEHVQRLEAAVGNGFIGLRRAVDAELDQAIAAVQEDLARRDQELRDGLRYVLAGGTRDRVIGVVLLALGIALGLVGSVLGNVP